MAENKPKAELPRLPAGCAIIDSHCHLDMIGPAAEMAKIVNRAAAAGVTGIITVGIDLASSKTALQLAEQFENVFATVGTHPHNVKVLDEKVYAELEKLSRSPKLVAYGEVGLDYVKRYASKALQRKHYDLQLDLALTIKLPLVIHDREAHADILASLAARSQRITGGVMHCFSGDWNFAKKILDLGFYISIPGVVTFNKAETLREVAGKLPLDRLLLETDAPFLTPVPLRGKKNFPEYVLYTAAHIAALRGLPLERLAEITTENCKKLFTIRIK